MLGQKRTSQIHLPMKERKGFRWDSSYVIGAVIGAAVLATLGATYFATRSRMPKFPPRRARWESRSMQPQIARFESEGGNVPEVQPLRVGDSL